MGMSTELITKTDKFRLYMRELYIYGFKSREEMEYSSNFKNYKLLIENILMEYMEKNKIGNKTAYTINFDSRKMTENPLHKIWKIHTFSKNQIRAFFFIMNYLQDSKEAKTIGEIVDGISEYGPVNMSYEDFMRGIESSSLTKKLAEFEKMGLIKSFSEKKQKKYYIDKTEPNYDNFDVLSFFQEHAPCSVVGSYILDNIDSEETSKFRFKHHFIADTMDSEIEYEILKAIQEKQEIEIKLYKSKIDNEDDDSIIRCVPLVIVKSVSLGREYMQAYVLDKEKIMPFRLSNIRSVNIKRKKSRSKENLNKKNLSSQEIFKRERKRFEKMKEHIWTVNGDFLDSQLKHIDFTIAFQDDEEYIYQRLVRESRCGTVTRISENSAKFEVDVYDVLELKPWIYTFIGRIVELNCTDKNFEKSIKEAIQNMCQLYNV